jgi:hypothetical protein
MEGASSAQFDRSPILSFRTIFVSADPEFACRNATATAAA